MIVWMTGASSGLGFYTALALREAGHTVIAGARSFTVKKETLGMIHLPLDVTDQACVDAFVAAALKVAPQVDAIVHCAGELVIGSCEETSAAEYAQVLNTNLMGVVRMNQAVLPWMRQAGHGRIIIFSSINGLLGVPFQSAYTASKHALEGYAECLQQETARDGIFVSLVEPGDHRGGAARYRHHAAAMDETSPYAARYASTLKVIEHDEHHGSDPMVLGRKVARLLEKSTPPFRKRIASTDQHLAVWLHRWLPQRWEQRVLCAYYFRMEKRHRHDLPEETPEKQMEDGAEK